MNRIGTGVALLLAVVLVGCGDSAPGGVDTAETEEARYQGEALSAAEVPAEALDRARATADALTSDLAGMVMGTMQEQGPVAAVEICSEVAQERTESFASEGVSVRRVSHRLRNPRNAPDAAEAGELDRLQRLQDAGEALPEVVRIVRRGDERFLHYVRPILVAQPCLTCHGAPERIDPDVARIIRDRYPSDAATGYQAGDLRGAVSVHVQLPPG
jgi:hypothetical protein